MARVRHERSAGGVLLLALGPEIYVALIELRGGTVLALPKGHIEPGEHPEETAVRETFEETGLRGRSIGELGEISYSFYSRERRTRIVKRVAFFLMRYQAGSPAHHNDEVEGVRLVRLDRAQSALSYRGEKDVLGRALDALTLLAGSDAPTAKERQAPASAGAAL